MKFNVFGPFELPRRDKGNLVDSHGKLEFWSEVHREDPGLADATGCYVYAITAPLGSLPWYVGKASKRFRNECFASHKINHYNYALAGRKGKPVLYLVARMVRTGKKFAKSGSSKSKGIDFLEKWLIGEALNRNPKLSNVRDTKLLQEIHVPGLLNSKAGHPGVSAVKLKNLFGK